MAQSQDRTFALYTLALLMFTGCGVGSGSSSSSATPPSAVRGGGTGAAAPASPTKSVQDDNHLIGTRYRDGNEGDVLGLEFGTYGKVRVTVGIGEIVTWNYTI